MSNRKPQNSSKPPPNSKSGGQTSGSHRDSKSSFSNHPKSYYNPENYSKSEPQDFVPSFAPTIESLRALEGAQSDYDVSAIATVAAKRAAAFSDAAKISGGPVILAAPLEEWERHISPEGKHFFYHRPTKRRQWEAPEGEGIRIVAARKKRRKLNEMISLPLYDAETGHAISSGTGGHVAFAGVEEAPRPISSTFIKGADLQALPKIEEETGPSTEVSKPMSLEELRLQLATSQNEEFKEIENPSLKFNPWGDDEFDLENLMDQVDDDNEQDEGI